MCVSLRSRTVSHFVTAVALCETTMSHCVRQIVHLSVSDVADYKASQDVSRVTNYKLDEPEGNSVVVLSSSP